MKRLRPPGLSYEITPEDLTIAGGLAAAIVKHAGLMSQWVRLEHEPPEPLGARVDRDLLTGRYVLHVATLREAHPRRP